LTFLLEELHFVLVLIIAINWKLIFDLVNMLQIVYSAVFVSVFNSILKLV